ncbi:DUF6612 family protein [Paenibacillus bouchesdurhonensis]|uniref:DUF6612 family protein n=1 Tax=Paenibacillus bouchesdurhonensis TaxID=1870990 RepID=UPI000DA63129|nr:DUF6612 family protein [Paenibacillus bouchesdurhonensis]
MKKLTAVLLGAVLLVGITACGKEKEAANANANTPAPTNANASANEAPSAQAEDALPTIDELITKSSEASKDLKSFKMDADIEQKMTIVQGDQEMKQDINIAMTMDVQQDPIAIYQEMTMDMGEAGKTEVKQYVTNDGIYTLADGTWVKLPNEMMADMVAQMEAAANPEAQLEQFKAIAEDSKVTEEGDEYIMSADLSGEGLKELAKNLMSQSGGGSAEETAAMMEMMNIKNIKISNTINKETYLPTKSDVYMEMDMDVEGQSISMVMVMKSTISKQNELEEIKVPQEVIDTAIQG